MAGTGTTNAFPITGFNGTGPGGVTTGIGREGGRRGNGGNTNYRQGLESGNYRVGSNRRDLIIKDKNLRDNPDFISHTNSIILKGLKTGSGNIEDKERERK
jgi:hypothetical protein